MTGVAAILPDYLRRAVERGDRQLDRGPGTCSVSLPAQAASLSFIVGAPIIDLPRMGLVIKGAVLHVSYDAMLRREVVLVGAHLDSWHTATGATDNADGVTAVMEAMRILMAVHARPRRTIRVALWGGEEQGLLGARAYVDQHLRDDLSRSRISVYPNDDPVTGPIVRLLHGM